MATCEHYGRGRTCGARAVVFVIESLGFRMGRTYHACAEHAPRPTANVELIETTVPGE